MKKRLLIKIAGVSEISVLSFLVLWWFLNFNSVNGQCLQSYSKTEVLCELLRSEEFVFGVVTFLLGTILLTAWRAGKHYPKVIKTTIAVLSLLTLGLIGVGLVKVEYCLGFLGCTLISVWPFSFPVASVFAGCIVLVLYLSEYSWYKN